MRSAFVRRLLLALLALVLPLKGMAAVTVAVTGQPPAWLAQGGSEPAAVLPLAPRAGAALAAAADARDTTTAAHASALSPSAATPSAANASGAEAGAAHSRATDATADTTTDAAAGAAPAAPAATPTAPCHAHADEADPPCCDPLHDHHCPHLAMASLLTTILAPALQGGAPLRASVGAAHDASIAPAVPSPPPNAVA